jgi:serine/threonine protein kinase
MRKWCWMPRYPVTLEQLGRPMPVLRATTVIEQMSIALRKLHSEGGLAHMDVKPSNIFVTLRLRASLWREGGDYARLRATGHAEAELRCQRSSRLVDVGHDCERCAPGAISIARARSRRLRSTHRAFAPPCAACAQQLPIICSNSCIGMPSMQRKGGGIERKKGFSKR